MKYELMTEGLTHSSPLLRILVNRGIPESEVMNYMNTTHDDVSDFMLLGEENLAPAYEMLLETISLDKQCLVIVDSDCDGYTSSAVLINYLHDWAPDWVENNLSYHFHPGKQHGLQGVKVEDTIALVIVPDAGSNDYEQHKELADKNIGVIVLDHHEVEKVSDDAIIINNQTSDYPNKSLSGVGVAWQFCRYCDSRTGNEFAHQYIDLVSLGLNADMMSLRSLETKHLINLGLTKDNLVNPFFYLMTEKNAFSLGPKLTPIGVAFYVSPFVNAMVRSGTQDEKELLFKSMLKHEAFKRVPSTKRGHKPGDEERIVDQALRVATNVKNRQTKSQIIGMEALDNMVISQNLLNNKVLIFLCKPGEVPPNIAGLVANKFMSKYQRNVLVLFPSTIEITNEDGEKTGEEVIWRGSARGYGKSTAAGFKDLCEATEVIEYAQGHLGAFGISIKEKNLPEFIQKTNELLKDDSGEATYYVDYVYNNKEVRGEDILEIAGLSSLWGQDMPEAKIAISKLKITKDMLTLMSPDKKPTLKIELPNRISIIKFRSSQGEYESLFSETGFVEINLVGTCNANIWNGNINPQIFITDYEILSTSKYCF